MIVCPIGFVADHIEVVWDLDEELRLQAERAGIAFARATTPNADPRFARLIVDLMDELRMDTEPARLTGPDPVPGAGMTSTVNLRALAVVCCAGRRAGEKSR